MEMYNTLKQGPLLSASPERDSIPGLMNNIISVHHGYFKKEIPLLAARLNKIVPDCGDTSEYKRINILFGILVEKISSLIRKEKNILFPRIAAMEQQRMAGIVKEVYKPNMESRIKSFADESNYLKSIVAQIRKLTNNYSHLPNSDENCNLVLASLEIFEINLLRHLYLDNILFMRALLT